MRLKGLIILSAESPYVSSHIDTLQSTSTPTLISCLLSLPQFPPFLPSFLLPSLFPSLFPSSFPSFALRGVQNQGLLHLSQSANKCKAVLEENLQLARRVVHLNELSRRLETVQEQVGCACVCVCVVILMCGFIVSLDNPNSVPCHAM